WCVFLPGSRSYVLALLARLAKRPRPCVETAEGARDLRVGLAQNAEAAAERQGIGAFHRAEASETRAMEGGAQRAATSLGDRPEARGSMGHQPADIALPLAFDADTIRRDI